MKRFDCGACGATVAFDASSCPTCATALGYLAPSRAVLALASMPDQPSALRPTGHHAGVRDERTFWRCLNAAWGCNWVVEANAGDVWCESCRLTRGRPDASRPDAVAAWSAAESIKRRLVDQLIVVGLPVGRFHADGSDDLSFDFVHVPAAPGATGHRPGRITIDLREVDDAYRESLRAELGEQERTVLGHLRHEVGHHYWSRLIQDAGLVGEFRHHFGDERTDYQEALRTHYAEVPGAARTGYVSAYAAAHPLEDWAETFARYLTVLDGLETASSFGLLGGGAADPGFRSMLHRWGDVAEATAEWARSTGRRPGPTGAERSDEVVTAKLCFVHRAVTGWTDRPAPPS